MDAATLSRAMCGSLPMSRYQAYAADFTSAALQAKCTTVNRMAMWCAQIGHESVGLRYMEEIASGAAYEGRKDLGNTQRGDGVRYKGRGPIQLTGRHNYGAFGKWAKSVGLVADANYFVNNPTAVATSKWGFLAAAWYWTVARPLLNSYADAGDVVRATRAINGGTNGLADRTRRWNTCRTIGNALIVHPAAPKPAAAAPKPRIPGGIESMAFNDGFKDWAGNQQTVQSWMNNIDKRLALLYSAFLSPGTQPSRIPGDKNKTNLRDAIMDSTSWTNQTMRRVIALQAAVANGGSATDPQEIAAALRPIVAEVVGPIVEESVTAALGEDNSAQAAAIVSEISVRLSNGTDDENALNSAEQGGGNA